MVQSFDVIVIGAGPAGLSVARNLAGSNLSVLVLEKNGCPGMKICSGEISSKVFPDFGAGIFREAQEWRSITVGTGKGKTKLDFSRPYLKTVGRAELEMFLAEKSGAEIHYSEPAKKITDSEVYTTKATYKYRYLVGADGSFSLVRSYLKLPAEHIVGWAYHFILSEPCSDFRVYWLPKLFPGGYGYMMSKNRDKTMVGGAMTGADLHKDLAPRVKKWAESEFGINARMTKSEAMKGNADFRGWRFGNIFLAGDAAGLLNPVTTEGIYYAVKSGEGIAKHILRNPEGGKIMKELGNTHRWQVLLFDIFSNPGLPFCWFVNWVLENPKGGIRKRIFGYVFWKFMDG